MSFYSVTCTSHRHWSQRASAQDLPNNSPLKVVLFTHSSTWQHCCVIQPHISFLLWLPQPSGQSCPVPRVHSAERWVGSRLARHCWLLPALSVRQRVLLLTCDEGGAPHRAAVAVPKPAHRGWRWVGGAAEAMVWLSLCSERRGRAPHHHGDRIIVSKCSLTEVSVCFVCLQTLWETLKGVVLITTATQIMCRYLQ